MFDVFNLTRCQSTPQTPNSKHAMAPVQVHSCQAWLIEARFQLVADHQDPSTQIVSSWHCSRGCSQHAKYVWVAKCEIER